MTEKRYIAYFDFLGFKYFIENNPHDFHIKIMNNVFRDIENALSQGKTKPASHGVIADLENAKINALNFSDTVVFWTKDDSLQSLSEILKVAHYYNSRNVSFFFPSRGTLIHGEMEYVDFKYKNQNNNIYNINSIFGQGLVDAHLNSENQSWAGAVIDKSILAQLNFFGLDETFLNEYAKKYKVPYKNNLISEEYAFKLVSGDLNMTSYNNLSANIISNFAKYNKPTDSIRVQEIITNTLNYLETFISLPNQ